MKQKTKFKETQIAKIPEDWRIKPIGEAIDINPKRELKKGTKSKYVSMQDIKEFNKKIISFIFRDFKGGSKFKNGDTLMARITPCLENGKTAFVDFLEDKEVGAGSTEFIVLSEKQKETINEFVYYLSVSPAMRADAIQSMTGTSGRQRVQTDLLVSKEVIIPPLPEQEKIAKILSDLDAKIELNNKMSQTFESLGKALFGKWFMDLEDIPKGWKTKPLDKIADFLNGLALQKYPAKDGEEYLPAIKIRELRSGITDQTDKISLTLPKEYLIEDGDILFSWSGSLEVVIWTNGKGALNQHLFKVSSKEYPKWFCYYWVKHHLPNFRHIAEGKATTMGHIQKHNLSESEVLVPDKFALDKMNAVMNPLLKKIISLKLEARNLEKIRDALLPKLMSGEIRVK